MRRSLATLLWMVVLATVAGAHVPHDTMNEVALSPDFANDQTVFGSFVFIDQRHFGRSLDGGRHWEMRQLPMAQHGIVGFAFSPTYATDGTAFCATGWGVYRTVDRGLHWQAINAGLTQLITTDIALSPSFASDGTVLLTTRTGFFRSTDSGDNWSRVEVGLTESKLGFVTVTTGAGGGAVTYIGGERLHRSENLGQSWAALHDFGTPVAALSPSPEFGADNTVAVALSMAGALVSTDGGASFTSSSVGLTDLATTDIAFTPGGALLLTSDQAVWRAAGPLQPWAPQVTGLQPLDPQGSPHFVTLALSPTFAADGTVLLASFEGCYRSLDGGLSWLAVNSFHQQLIKNVAVSPDFANDRLVLATSPGAGLIGWQLPQPEPVVSPSLRANGASVMSPASTGPAPTPRSLVPGPKPVGSVPGKSEALSAGLGSLWNEGLALSPDFAADNTVFFAYVGAYRSADRGLSWTSLPLPPGVIIARDIAVSPAYSADQTVFVGTNGTGFFRSTDRGDSWVAADGGLPADFKTRRISVSPDFANDQTLFAASWNHGVWKSGNGGSSWQPTASAIPNVNLQSLALSPDFGNDAMALAGEKPGRLWRTVDGGGSWQPADQGLPFGDGMVVTGVAFSPHFAADRMIAAATGDGALWLSTDGADSWQLVTRYTNGTVRSLAFAPSASPSSWSADVLLVAGPPQLLALRPLRSLGNGQLAATSPVLVRGEGSDLGVVASAGWSSVATNGSFGSTTTRTSSTGAWREWEFFGDSISCYGEQGPDAPLVDILLDDVPAATADLYAPTVEQQVPFFEQTFLQTGWHTVRITHSGQANPLSTGSALATDGFATTR